LSNFTFCISVVVKWYPAAEKTWI